MSMRVRHTAEGVPQRTHDAIARESVSLLPLTNNGEGSAHLVHLMQTHENQVQ